MPFTRCAYHNCRLTSWQVTMFRFPTHDPNRLKLWIRNSGNKKLESFSDNELSNQYICALHFRPSSVNFGKRSRLLGPAVPSSSGNASLPLQEKNHYLCKEHTEANDITKNLSGVQIIPEEVPEYKPITYQSFESSPNPEMNVEIPKKVYAEKAMNMPALLPDPLFFVKNGHETSPVPETFKVRIPQKVYAKKKIDMSLKIKKGPPKPHKKITILPLEPRDIQTVPSASLHVDGRIPDTYDDGPEWCDDDVMIHEDVISDTEDEVVVPARSRDIQDEHHYVPIQHEDYSCNVCAGPIVGFRYVCVQCRDWDMCGTCEAAGSHAAHYVLRVPAPRAFAEMKSVLDAVRKALELSAHDPLYSGALLRPDTALDDDEIKTETVWDDVDSIVTDNFVPCDNDNTGDYHDEPSNDYDNTSTINNIKHDNTDVERKKERNFAETLEDVEMAVTPSMVSKHTVAVNHLDQSLSVNEKPPERLTQIPAEETIQKNIVVKCPTGNSVKRKKRVYRVNMQPRVMLKKLRIPKNVFRLKLLHISSDKTKKS